jgi:hypothetical protein
MSGAIPPKNMSLRHAQGLLELYPHISFVLHKYIYTHTHTHICIYQTKSTECLAETVHQVSPQSLFGIDFVQTEI